MADKKNLSPATLLWLDIARILIQNGLQMISDWQANKIDPDKESLLELKARLAAIKRPPVKK